MAAWLLLVILAASCKSTKTIQKAINKKDTTSTKAIIHLEVDSAFMISEISNKIKEGKIDFNAFSAKIKVDFTDPSNKTREATAFIRLQKDSLMWVSLTGTLGVEGFRALIRPDSVWVMDKLEKTISRRSTASLQEITNLPLDFEALQDLIIGNPVYFSDSIVSYKYDANMVTALSIGEFFKHLLSIDTVKNTITHSKIDDVIESSNRTCHIWLNDYLPVQGRNFSTKREITITEKSKLNIKLDFKQYAFDEVLSFPFSIPKSYKEK